jgi:hypothetical protein
MNRPHPGWLLSRAACGCLDHHLYHHHHYHPGGQETWCPGGWGDFTDYSAFSGLQATLILPEEAVALGLCEAAEKVSIK